MFYCFLFVVACWRRAGSVFVKNGFTEISTDANDRNYANGGGVGMG